MCRGGIEAVATIRLSPLRMEQAFIGDERGGFGGAAVIVGFGNPGVERGAEALPDGGMGWIGGEVDDFVRIGVEIVEFLGRHVGGAEDGRRA